MGDGIARHSVGIDLGVLCLDGNVLMYYVCYRSPGLHPIYLDVLEDILKSQEGTWVANRITFWLLHFFRKNPNSYKTLKYHNFLTYLSSQSIINI